MTRRVRSLLIVVVGLAGLALAPLRPHAQAQAPSDGDGAAQPVVDAVPLEAVASPDVSADSVSDDSVPVDPPSVEPSGIEPTAEEPATALATPPTLVAAEPEPTVGPVATEAESTLPASSVDLRRIAAFEGTAGFALLSRHFHFTDDVYGFLRPYTLPLGPAVAFDVRWYPGAHFTRGIGSSFGVDLRFDRSFGIQSERDGTLRYPTVDRVIEASALGRWSYRGHAFVASLGYGNHAFEVRNAHASAPGLNPIPDVPSVAYSYLRYGLEARIVPHDRVGIIAGLAYLQVLDTGGISTDVWFPRNEAGGVAMNAAVVVGLPYHVELRAGLEYRRYFHSMHSREGDPFIAGGALDQYTRFQLAAAYRY